MEIHSGPNVQRITTIHAYSIFEMVEQQAFQKNTQLYFYYPDGDNLKWKFYTTFYTHPLLPNTIAQALRKFNIDNKKAYIRSSVFNQEGIIIGNVVDPIPGSHIFYVVDFDHTLDTTIGFKKAVLELKASIVDWLEDYGIEDINLIDK